MSCDDGTLMELFQGNTKSQTLTFLQSDAVTPYDLTDAVIEFFVTEDPALDLPVIEKRSYNPSTDIFITDTANGLALLILLVKDTIDLPAGLYCWHVRVSRKRTTTVSLSGTFDVVSGSKVLQYTGSDLSNLSKGDMIQFAGSSFPGTNGKLFLVSNVDLINNQITIQYIDWTDETALVPSAWLVDRDTPSGGFGTFKLKDVTGN